MEKQGSGLAWGWRVVLIIIVAVVIIIVAVVVVAVVAVIVVIVVVAVDVITEMRSNYRTSGRFRSGNDFREIGSPDKN